MEEDIVVMLALAIVAIALYKNNDAEIPENIEKKIERVEDVIRESSQETPTVKLLTLRQLRGSRVV